ncbi:hypothetical protein ACLKA6_015911 [Drosophila palustris]
MEACKLDAHLNNPMLAKELIDKLPSQHKLSWAMPSHTDHQGVQRLAISNSRSSVNRCIAGSQQNEHSKRLLTSKVSKALRKAGHWFRNNIKSNRQVVSLVLQRNTSSPSVMSSNVQL